MVFGGYLAAGGKIGTILKALPFDLMMIGGAAVGAFFLSNDIASVKRTVKGLGKVFKGPTWKAQDFQDLLCLLYELIRNSGGNPMDLEAHIQEPEESAVFVKYPNILADKAAVEMICDTMRAGSMNDDDPHQVEEVLENRLESKLHHAMHSSHALQTMADGLPALGIVAAALGVIKTMASIDQPPEVLGRMIGGALLGTFLGVFLAYALAGPFAAKVKSVIEADHQVCTLIREVLVANLHNHARDICVEVGRQNTLGEVRPSFSALNEALRGAKRPA